MVETMAQSTNTTVWVILTTSLFRWKYLIVAIKCVLPHNAMNAANKIAKHTIIKNKFRFFLSLLFLRESSILAS